MAIKRKQDADQTNISLAATDSKTQPRPQKRRKQEASKEDVTYTVTQILVFKDAISAITDWSSSTVAQKHVQVIHWFDVLGLTKDECAERYPNKEGKPCSAANIYKVYNTWAPRFYAEKAVAYIPLGKRGIARAAKTKKNDFVNETQKKGPARGGRRIGGYESSKLDTQLAKLFGKIPGPTTPAARGRRDSNQGYCHGILATQPDIGYLQANNMNKDTLDFQCKDKDGSSYGPRGSISISRASVMQYCTTIHIALLSKPSTTTINYGPAFPADTISRFAACITPTLQTRLPTHITTPFGTFEQQWSMSELEDLYVFAVTVGAGAVCDMVINRWIEEMRCVEPRIIQDEFGEDQIFNILDFGPELLSFLAQNDEQGSRFFLNVLIAHGEAGWVTIRDAHLGNWHEKVKKSLVEMMQNGQVIDLFSASQEIICQAFHHQGSENEKTCFTDGKPPQPIIIAAPPAQRPLPGSYDNTDLDSENEEEGDVFQIKIPDFPNTHTRHPLPSLSCSDPISRSMYTYMENKYRSTPLDNRIQYHNPKFNTHHDTAEVCLDKIRMVREKLALFKKEGIEVGDEEVEKALGVTGDEEQDDKDDSEDDELEREMQRALEVEEEDEDEDSEEEFDVV